jgi:hypothetical protein
MYLLEIQTLLSYLVYDNSKFIARTVELYQGNNLRCGSNYFKHKKKPIKSYKLGVSSATINKYHKIISDDIVIDKPDLVIFRETWLVDGNVVYMVKKCPYNDKIHEIKKSIDVDIVDIVDSRMDWLTIKIQGETVDELELELLETIKTIDIKFYKQIKLKIIIKPVLKVLGIRYWNQAFPKNVLCTASQWIKIRSNPCDYICEPYINGIDCLIMTEGKTVSVITKLDVKNYTSNSSLEKSASWGKVGSKIYSHLDIDHPNFETISKLPGNKFGNIRGPDVCGIVFIQDHNRYLYYYNIHYDVKAYRVPVKMIGIHPYIIKGKKIPYMLLCKTKRSRKDLPKGYGLLKVGKPPIYWTDRPVSMIRVKWDGQWKLVMNVDSIDTELSVHKKHNWELNKYSLSINMNVSDKIDLPQLDGTVVTSGIYYEGCYSLDRLYPNCKMIKSIDSVSDINALLLSGVPKVSDLKQYMMRMRDRCKVFIVSSSRTKIIRMRKYLKLLYRYNTSIGMVFVFLHIKN